MGGHKPKCLIYHEAQLQGSSLEYHDSPVGQALTLGHPGETATRKINTSRERERA